MKKAIFPGSFDPFTLGHADIVRRGLQVFDHIVIAVGVNEHKQGWIAAKERLRALRELYKDNANVSVERYEGLTTDFAKRCGAGFILRGVRSLKDFEYELDMADVNRQLDENLETVVLLAHPELSAVSSSMVRELHHFGHDIQTWLPEDLNYKL